MRIGCPAEIKNHEYRVGLTPESVHELATRGHEVWIESGAGAGIDATDDKYREAGAHIVEGPEPIFAECEMVVKVKEPQPEERARLREGQILYTYLHLAPDPDQIADLLASGVTAIAYETVTGPGRTLPLLKPMSQVAGDASGGNDFRFLKPSLALTWQASEAVQMRAGLRRTVGQLDFNDFAASANAEDDRLLAGNPDLGPDQTWRASLTADLRLPGGWALNAQGFHEWRSDVLEQVILPSGVPGLANAGTARVWGIETEAALPLARFIKGGLLEVSADFRDAKFRDPITGESRVVTGLTNPDIDIDFRQDLTEARIAWGVTFEPAARTTSFFANETIIDRRGRRLTTFAETTRFFGVKMRLEASNLFQTRFPRERQLFAPDRGGTFIGSEELDRERGEFVTFTISDQF